MKCIKRSLRIVRCGEAGLAHAEAWQGAPCAAAGGAQVGAHGVRADGSLRALVPRRSGGRDSATAPTFMLN
jgi:hypothetical protein